MMYLKSAAAAVAEGPARHALASWTPLWVLLAGLAVTLAVLVALGRGGVVQRLPSGLERVTGIPGWSAASVGLTLFASLVASFGFNSDVAWHVALGRDKNLFTAPHTMLIIGLLLLPLSAEIGVVFATVTDADVGIRVGPFRVPRSMLALGALGVGAVAGFPLDALWHQHYGIDVTLWSPTHLLMVLGGSLAVFAAWLALGEAGVRPSDGGWARAAHVLLGWLALTSLSGVWTEFKVGVPQFQLLFAPVLVCIGAAVALVAIRMVLGRGYPLGITVVNLLLSVVHLGGSARYVPTRPLAIFIGSALAVEGIGAWLGTERRLRFAAWSGVGVATLGLAVEFWWNQGAPQPWRASLFPAALCLGLVAAVAAAVIGTAYGAAVAHQPTGVRSGVMIVATLALGVVLAVPLPRHVGRVDAAIHLQPAGRGMAFVQATLRPADAAHGARWFQVMAWQYGSLQLSEMHKLGEGVYLSDAAVPVAGPGKTVLRLQRGDQVMGIAIHLPADPEIHAPLVTAADRTAPFVSERAFLLREQHGGPQLLAHVVYGALALIALLWIGAFVLASQSPVSADPRRPSLV